MSTRRETLVTVLNGGTPTPGELAAMNAVPGVQAFLNLLQDRGITSADAVARLRAFKDNGGSGLASAIVNITDDLNASGNCQEQKDALQAIIDQATAALKGIGA